MAVPASRPDFVQFCLRRLGKPVIQVNVTDEQVDDAIDYALAKFKDYHFDGTERMFIAHQITDTDVTNKSITLPDNVIEVVDISPFTGTLLGTGIWSLTYQALFTSMDMFRSFDTTGWVMLMYNLEFMSELFAGKPLIHFSRYNNILRVDTDWTQIPVGTYLIADCYVGVDPTVQTKIWSDQWLQQYTTALVKRQWGNNLKKYNGVQMLGGITFNGQQIYEEAEEEIVKLDAELITNYSQLPPDLIG